MIEKTTNGRNCGMISCLEATNECRCYNNQIWTL